MSYKRPNESSWDSDDEDLLYDDTSGINAFRDDEIDEDALLGGSDDDIDPSIAGEDLIARMEEDRAFESESADFSVKEEDTVLDVVVDEEEEEEILGLTAGSEFDESNITSYSDAGQVSNVSVNISRDEELESDQATEELLSKEEPPEESEPDVSVQSQEEDEEDEESDEDEDKDHRGRFKSERSDSVTLKSARPARDNIPDTLEISAEEQARIDQMQSEIDNRKNNRARRGKKGWGGGRGRRPQQHQHLRYRLPNNQNVPGLLGNRPGIMHGPVHQGPRHFGHFAGPHNNKQQRMLLHQHHEQQPPPPHQHQPLLQPPQPLLPQPQQQPKPQPPYPVPTVGQNRQVIHINPHFRPRTYSGAETVQTQAGPLPSVTPPMSMGQTQLAASNYRMPAMVQGPHNPPFQQRPTINSGWTGSQSQPPPHQEDIGQRLPFPQGSQQQQQQQHIRQPFPQQQHQLGVAQMRQQVPGGMPPNSNLPNHTGNQTRNQIPQNFSDRSPPLNEAPWNRNLRFPGQRLHFQGGPMGQHPGPDRMQQSPNHHHQHRTPFHPNQAPLQAHQPQGYPSMQQTQNIPRPQQKPREGFQGPRGQIAGNARFGFQGPRFGSPPDQQHYQHQMQHLRQPAPQGMPLNVMEQGPQPIQTVLRGGNLVGQRGQAQGQQKSPSAALKLGTVPQEAAVPDQNGPQNRLKDKLQEMSEERKKLIMRQRRFAASDVVKVNPGTKIKLSTGKTGQSVVAAKRLQIAHQRQAALKRRSSESPNVSPPKQAKKTLPIDINSPLIKKEKAASKIHSAEDMLNADLADKLEKQARLREAVKRKKEERRQEMAQERRNRLIEDLKSQGLTLDDIAPEAEGMPPPAQPAVKVAVKQQNDALQKRAQQPPPPPQQQQQQQFQPHQQQQMRQQRVPQTLKLQGPGKKIVRMTKSQYQVAQHQGKNVQAIFTKSHQNQRGRGQMRGKGRGQGHSSQVQNKQGPPRPQTSPPQVFNQVAQRESPNLGLDTVRAPHQGNAISGVGRGRGHVNRGAMQKPNFNQGKIQMHHGGQQQTFQQQPQQGPHVQQSWNHHGRGRGNHGNVGNRGALSQVSRTVVPPSQSHHQGPCSNRRIVLGNEAQSKVIIIRNLNTSTPIQTIEQMCWQMGHVENIRKTSQTECYVVFSLPEQAGAFRNKYNRFMLDLSMISVDFVQT